MNQPSSDAIVLKQGAANLQRGIETVGGKLQLTQHNLMFVPHKFNFQRGEVVLRVHDIHRTNLVWTKFLNVFPIAPNSLEVHMIDGSSYRFVLYKRKEWKSIIDETVAA